MATVAELREKLRRPLSAELASGCQNRVVAGGVEKLLASPLGNPFPQVREALRGYGEWSADAREEALKGALALLSDGKEKPAAVKATSRSAVPAAAPGERLPPDAPVERLNTGPGGARKLQSLGLPLLRDVLHAYPHRHEDRRALPDLAEVEEGQKITVEGRVVAKSRRSPRPGMLVIDVTLETPAGGRVKATWFNQPWVEKQLREGARLVLTGRVKKFGRSVQLGVEHLETVDGAQDSLSTGRIVGVYDTREGISQEFLRRAAHRALETVPLDDYLPAHWRRQYGLTDLGDALWGMHFPQDEQHLSRASARLRFDEYLFLELRMLLQGEDAVLEGKRFNARSDDIHTFESALPFRFTNAQRRVLLEITDDMRSDRQMARLVQGDVGSGKTAVAACALYLAVRDGYQGALMAPTEILARQHYANLLAYLGPLDVRVGLLIGAMTPKTKLEMQARIAEGSVDVVVGTQALIQENVRFDNLGLAVVDEEHRFGVQQRRKLLSGRPDVLVMSATPIPRSLALTAYGDLELSIIDELPPGRTPVETKLIQDTFRAQAYGFVMGQIREGRQAFVVTSLIEESDTLELLAATQLADDLKVILPEARIDLLHGKMTAAEKDFVMESFRRREFDILVSTTVIEVGVDVPNATVMVIENAERFGLSQLHQLRGRVGRGSAKSYCVLVAGEHSQKTRKRLKIIEGSTDGFVIAEADLKLRGPGELRGTRQSGIPDLRLADLANDTQIIEQARELAKHILAHDPKLEHPRLQYLRSELQNRSQSVAFREVI
ncbi:ATP-dependent DNA helicase RecG [Deinococcus metalli]|uniref:ATP-dependent DNA helicase RecG n=1 Tax=Deinococcus metalli TaxID=1141878 RepID=A0A7W8KHG6_9DEIO|nr:ATP-dependent DNA helicase RecG [Deinococcus metalli]MBB5377086.1 ATP-dependent DNA helicase RecG [Deinococcus metalli]GHF49103.1 ATP-dependent DNA helicase RecG [Deinococcus metalli]